MSAAGLSLFVGVIVAGLTLPSAADASVLYNVAATGCVPTFTNGSNYHLTYTLFSPLP